MLPLFVLLGSLLAFRGLGALGAPLFLTWRDSAAWALCVMLFATASAHFTLRKEDLIKMVPRFIPAPRLIVWATGLLELAGAVGLLIPPLRTVAAICLTLLFMALVPANINAAMKHIPFGGRNATPLWLRLPTQASFIAVALFIAIG